MQALVRRDDLLRPAGRPDIRARAAALAAAVRRRAARHPPALPRAGRQVVPAAAQPSRLRRAVSVRLVTRGVPRFTCLRFHACAIGVKNGLVSRHNDGFAAVGGGVAPEGQSSVHFSACWACCTRGNATSIARSKVLVLWPPASSRCARSAAATFGCSARRRRRATSGARCRTRTRRARRSSSKSSATSSRPSSAAQSSASRSCTARPSAARRRRCGGVRARARSTTPHSRS